MPVPRFPALVAAVTERYRRLATLWVLVPALMAMVAFLVLFQVAGRMVAAGGATGLELQRAFTPERFGAVVGAWGDGVEAFKTSLILLDFAFPLIYAAGLGSLVALVGGPGPGRAARWLFVLPWVAAGLDWIENLLHLWLLTDVHTAADALSAAFPAPVVLAASLAAMLKFALLLAAAAGAVVLALRRRYWWGAAAGAALFASFTSVLWA
ncbi:MAG: hypothetical protein ABIJ48_00580 [Actinomycetota bacterium]